MDDAYVIRATTVSQVAKREVDELSEKIWRLRFLGRAVFLIAAAVLGVVAARYAQ